MGLFTNIARITLWLLAAVTSGTLLILASAYLYLSPTLPPVEALRAVQLQTPLRIYTADEQLIGEFGEKRRTPIQFEQIPPQFIQALLAAEDDAFYEHRGVDIFGLLRAASQLLATQSIQTGGSTITMQVAKNYFLSRERTFSRKFNEILLAIQIERELTKNEILELYLNKIFFGNRAYGVQAAAQVYYGRTLDQLALPQFAMIAGLPKAPSSFNPLVNPSRALERRDWILGRMLSLGYITPEDYRDASQSPITAKYHGSIIASTAPYVAEMVRKEMLTRYGRSAYTDGYRVFTTIDSRLQNAARKAVTDGLDAYDKRHGYRGPEGNYYRENLEDTELQQQWLTVLNELPIVGNLVPAIVSRVEEQHFVALLAEGEELSIGWETVKDIRPYIDANRRGASPKSLSDIVTVGDLIRLKPSDEGWELAQVPAAQAALVALNADNGGILSLIGGYDYHASKFNRITQATRQPGSNFKPFVYTAALDKGYTPASIINDAPIVFDDNSLESTWRPSNDSGKFYGPTRLRNALFKSRNLVSIRLLRGLGIPEAIDYSARFGFDPQQLPRDLSLALGSHSLTPMEIVRGYAVFANGGYYVEPYLIQRIEKVDEEVLYEALPATVCRDCEETPEMPTDGETEQTHEANSLEDLLADEELDAQQLANTDDAMSEEKASPPPAKQVLEPRVAYLIDSMLRDVVTRGTGRRALSLKRSDLGGKTGTTNGPTDAWFSGYGGGVVTTTWLGFDKNGILGRREYGGSAALPIWIDYMRTALAERPERRLKQPEGTVTVKIDPKTGLLARPGQYDAIFETFRVENAPSQQITDNGEGGSGESEPELMVEDIF